MYEVTQALRWPAVSGLGVSRRAGGRQGNNGPKGSGQRTNEEVLRPWQNGKSQGLPENLIKTCFELEQAADNSPLVKNTQPPLCHTSRLAATVSMLQGRGVLRLQWEHVYWVDCGIGGVLFSQTSVTGIENIFHCKTTLCWINMLSRSAAAAHSILTQAGWNLGKEEKGGGGGGGNCGKLALAIILHIPQGTSYQGFVYKRYCSTVTITSFVLLFVNVIHLVMLTRIMLRMMMVMMVMIMVLSDLLFTGIK